MHTAIAEVGRSSSTAAVKGDGKNSKKESRGFMIYLTRTKGDKISASKMAKKRGEYPEAVYDHETNKIIILKSTNDLENMIGVLNHEFMHKILDKNNLRTASEKWDSDFIIDGVETWLGWYRPFLLESLIRQLSKIILLSR